MSHFHNRLFSNSFLSTFPLFLNTHNQTPRKYVLFVYSSFLFFYLLWKFFNNIIHHFLFAIHLFLISFQKLFWRLFHILKCKYLKWMFRFKPIFLVKLPIYHHKNYWIIYIKLDTAQINLDSSCLLDLDECTNCNHKSSIPLELDRSLSNFNQSQLDN